MAVGGGGGGGGSGSGSGKVAMGISTPSSTVSTEI